jgi:L-rhamnose mutarotase
MDLYKKLHADDNTGVRDLLRKYNINNFSIFIKQLDDGKEYLFGYYEYTGKDYDVDMAKLAEEPRNIEWLNMCDPCQVPLKGHNSWTEMDQIYFNE